MGVHNSRYERVTMYLRKDQLDFLDSIIRELSVTNADIPNRSELIRALLDKYCVSNALKKGLYEEIVRKSNIIKNS